MTPTMSPVMKFNGRRVRGTCVDLFVLHITMLRCCFLTNEYYICAGRLIRLICRKTHLTLGSFPSQFALDGIEFRRNGSTHILDGYLLGVCTGRCCSAWVARFIR
jgi:hypothetical protein